jgi:hypothetical protein
MLRQPLMDSPRNEADHGHVLDKEPLSFLCRPRRINRWELRERNTLLLSSGIPGRFWTFCHFMQHHCEWIPLKQSREGS